MMELSKSSKSALIRPSSIDNNNWVSNSNNEPNAIDKKWANSLLEYLEEPSAMFDGTEMAHLEIWDINPNFSDGDRLPNIR